MVVRGTSEIHPTALLVVPQTHSAFPLPLPLEPDLGMSEGPQWVLSCCVRAWDTEYGFDVACDDEKEAKEGELEGVGRVLWLW